MPIIVPVYHPIMPMDSACGNVPLIEWIVLIGILVISIATFIILIKKELK